MSIFHLILFGIPALSLIWLVWAVRTRAMRRAGRGARVALALGTAGLLAGYAWIVLARGDRIPWAPPSWLQAAVLLWGLMFLPLVAFPSLVGGAMWQAVTRIRRLLASVGIWLTADPTTGAGGDD